MPEGICNPYSGKSGRHFEGKSRYEDVDIDVRRSIASDLEALLRMCPEDMQDVQPFVHGSWGYGTAFWGSDLDVVFSPDNDDDAPGLREKWLARRSWPNYWQVSDFIEEISWQYQINISVSFGLKPSVSYDVRKQKPVGRREGETVLKKNKFNRVTKKYEAFDIPVQDFKRGSYLEPGEIRMPLNFIYRKHGKPT